MINRIRVEVMGTGYTFATPEDEDYVRGLARELDSQIRELMENNPRLSLNDALVLCAMNYVDSYRKSEEASDHMRAQLTDYLEDAARARIELDDAKREIERLRRQLEAKQPHKQ